MLSLWIESYNMSCKWAHSEMSTTLSFVQAFFKLHLMARLYHRTETRQDLLLLLVRSVLSNLQNCLISLLNPPFFLLSKPLVLQSFCVSGVYMIAAIFVFTFISFSFVKSVRNQQHSVLNHITDLQKVKYVAYDMWHYIWDCPADYRWITDTRHLSRGGEERRGEERYSPKTRSRIPPVLMSSQPTH